MITCRELADFIRGYLDDELTLREKMAFQAHLVLCAPCRAYLKTYKETIELGRRVFGEDADTIPPDVPEDLVKAVMESRKKLWP
jgi:predicted anti-sigma-YlaC factor YlaD